MYETHKINNDKIEMIDESLLLSVN